MSHDIDDVATGMAAGSLFMFLKEKGKAERSDIVAYIDSILDENKLPHKGDETIDKFLGNGLLVEIGGSIMPSEKGATISQIVRDKLSVAGITGDDNLDFDEDDRDKINSKSTDLPG